MEIVIASKYEEIVPDAKFERRPHGTILIGDKEVAHTLQCPHCQMHFVSIRGSGIRRVWCGNCSAVTCGRPECDNCAPWEAQMEAIERAARVMK